MVSTKFIQNVKALSERRVLTEDELKLIMVCIQEVATISPVELMSLLDNIDLVIEEGQTELSTEDYEQIRKDLLEEVGLEPNEEGSL